MRIVVDLQGAQVKKRNTVIRNCSIFLTQALVRNIGSHEIILVLNSHFTDSILDMRNIFKEMIPRENIQVFDVPGPVAEFDSGNEWRTRSAELIREDFIDNLKPDILLISSLFEGYSDDAVISIGKLTDTSNVAVLFYGLEHLPQSDTGIKEEKYQIWYRHKIAALQKAGIVLTLSEYVRQEALKTFQFTKKQVINISVEEALLNPAKVIVMTEISEKSLKNENYGIQFPENEIVTANKLSWDNAARITIDTFEVYNSLRLRSRGKNSRNVSALKPTLAFVSPLPPDRSGIADYSAELIPELTRYYEITMINDQIKVSDPWLADNLPLKSVDWFEKYAESFDRILYQMGNSHFHQHMFSLLNKYPGIVVLHDFYLSGVLNNLEELFLDPAVFRLALYYSHGYRALIDYHKDIEMAKKKWPANYQVFKDADGVIVHSEYSKILTRQFYGDHYINKLKIIPHLRKANSRLTRKKARFMLGLSEGDYVICSFGNLNPFKLNDQLLTAWFDSGLAKDKNNKLVFVGENHWGGYGKSLIDKAKLHQYAKNLKITGYASVTDYQSWLAAADVAVQLRTDSRGETSGAVLDCLAAGLPLIINAHGSAAEIPDKVCFKIPDTFNRLDLVSALETFYNDSYFREHIGAAGKQYITNSHKPQDIGRKYYQAIESFAATGSNKQYGKLIDSIAELDGSQCAAKKDLQAVAEIVSRHYTRRKMVPSLYLDVTEVASNDLLTGIQRVTRAVLKGLITNPPYNYRVEPVYEKEGSYYYAHRYTFSLLGIDEIIFQERPVTFKNKDLFFGLDWVLDRIINNRDNFFAMRALGVKVGFLIYDLLPVFHPEFFPKSMPQIVKDWLHTICEVSDILVCISESTSNDLKKWILENKASHVDKVKIFVSHSGADIEAGNLTTGLRDSDKLVINALNDKIPIFLMVSTVEPRKGYAQTLLAFELLWQYKLDVKLVIVGKKGWEVDVLINQIINHPELGKRLFWVEGCSDEMLLDLYKKATAVIAASEGEGFGLPLIEAARQNVPIIARDIPVFREVAGDHAYYFSGLNPESLAEAVIKWLVLKAGGKAPASGNIAWLTWEKSVEQLKAILLQ